MAIQFNCPYCTATIQVPDYAAGKKGTCPQCQIKLIVPKPREMPSPAAAAPPMPAPFVTASQSPPGFVPPQFAPNVSPQGAFVSQWPPPGPHAPPFVPAPGVPPQYMPVPQMPYPGFDPSQSMLPPADSIEQPSVVKRYKKRMKRRSGWVVWGPIGVIVIFVGLLVFLFLKQGAPKRDPLKGELTAVRRDDGKLEPALVHREWIGLDEDVVDTVLKQMEKRSVTLRSSTIVLRFKATEEGIRVTVEPGEHAELIAVDINRHKGLATWQARESAGLTDKHQKEVIKAAERFIKEWAEAEASGEKKRDFARFHDELGLAALTMGLGGEAIAVVGETVYRCVAEQQGKLFFLLPPGTQRFELQGRERGKNKFVFPGQFKVKVIADESPKRSSKKSGEKKSDSDDETPPAMDLRPSGEFSLDEEAMSKEKTSEKGKAKKKTLPKDMPKDE